MKSSRLNSSSVEGITVGTTMVGMGPVFTGAAMPSAAATVGAEAQVGMAGIVVVTSVEAAAIVVVMLAVLVMRPPHRPREKRASAFAIE